MAIPYLWFRGLVPRLQLCVLMLDETDEIVIQGFPIGDIGDGKWISGQCAANLRIKGEMGYLGDAIVIEAKRQKTDRDCYAVDAGYGVVFEPRITEAVGKGGREDRKGVMVCSQMSQSGGEGCRKGL